MNNRFELVFTQSQQVGRYKRIHRSIESAQAEVSRIQDRYLETKNVGDPQRQGSGVESYAGNAILYGPGCGPNGRSIAWYDLRVGA